MKLTADEWIADRDHAARFPGARGTFGGNRVPESYARTIGRMPTADDPGALPYDVELFLRTQL